MKKVRKLIERERRGFRLAHQYLARKVARELGASKRRKARCIERQIERMWAEWEARPKTISVEKGGTWGKKAA